MPIRGFSQIAPVDLEKISFINFPLNPDSTQLSDKINRPVFSRLDARDDTGNIGYFKKTEAITKTIMVKSCQFDSGFSNSVTVWFAHYLNAFEKNKTGFSIFANIKKFRYSSEATPVKYDNSHEGQPNNGWEEGVICKIEFFLQKDSLFTQLYMYDSIITIPEKKYVNIKEPHASSENKIAALFATALKYSLSKLFTLNLDSSLSTGRKIHFSDIKRVNNKRYELPVYTAGSLNKGVYKTFEEFKMNAPSIQEYEFKNGKMGDILYVKENGEEYPMRSDWGYCDGKGLFINSGDKYSKLARSGNGFYFKGIKSIVRNQKYVVGGDLSGSSYDLSKTKFKKKLFFTRLIWKPVKLISLLRSYYNS